MINLALIHGWGSDSRTWQPLLEPLQSLASISMIDLPGFGTSPVLPEFSLDAVLEKIASQLPQDAVIMGWSLGGMLAVQLAARFPKNVRAVVTLGANLKFVAAADYPTAMPQSVNRRFNQDFAQDPHSTLKLFGGLLVKGDADELGLLKQLRRNDVGAVNENWVQALHLLTNLDNRIAFAQLVQPGLHLLADNDVLVPVAAVEVMREINPRQKIEVFENTSHLLHWSKPQAVIESLTRFLTGNVLSSAKPEPRLDKKKVAQSFSRAAVTYDSAAQLQRDIGAQLFAGLSDNLPAQSLVLDLGSGTGFFTQQLAAKYRQSRIVGLDIAQGMLHYAAEQRSEISWLCADAELLPFADNSVDIIFSSLAIQWCNNLPQLFSELTRVLKLGGCVHIATLGPHTLHELKSAWQKVDDYVHVNRFQSMQAVVEAISSQLIVDNVRQENRTLYYERLVDLTRELKALGAHNINSGKPEGLTGRSRLLAFKNAYELLRTPKGLSATYDVIYVTASKN